jgi:retron-type reverse transcriptase
VVFGQNWRAAAVAAAGLAMSNLKGECFMTFDACRRGRSGVAGARGRLEPADRHTGSLRGFLRRHEQEAAAAARGTAATRRKFVAKLLTRTADSRNLRLAWDHLASGEGQAPGLDGLRFNDLDHHEVWDLARALHEAILDGTYRTTPDLQKRIPKSSGKGFRMLSIPSVVDRVVQRAVVQIIQPYLNPTFDERSLGYRPGIDVNAAVAMAEDLIVREGRWVLLAEDLKDAFNHVPQRRLLGTLGTHLRDDGMMRLLERVLLTRKGQGLRQGGPLSPIALNTYLDHFLDKKWRRLHPDMAMLRWVDDVLVSVRDREEARQAHQDLTSLLRPAGMSLKSTPERSVHNLGAGEHAEWLGYRLSRGRDGLKVSLTEKAWRSLAEKLELDHEKDGSPLRAVDTILGWVSSMGPCYATTHIPTAYARIGSLANALAFDEIPSQEEVRRTWRTAHLRWERSRVDREQRTQEQHAAAPPAR